MKMNLIKTLLSRHQHKNLIFKQFFSLKTGDPRKLADTTWDVIVSGGGMVGCALACALGSSDILAQKNILLLESSPKTEYVIDPNKNSNRVCAINPNSKSLFESFGAWEKMRNLRMREVKKMCIWESVSDARISFQHFGMEDDIAYVIENDVILKSLYSTLEEMESRVNVLTGTKAANYHLPADQSDLVSIHISDAVQLKTKLLIGADGVSSLVRNKMGVKHVSWNYNQKGIVATLKLAEPCENLVAWQRFLPTGPIALLPLSDMLCSLVWTVSNPMAEKLLRKSDEEFIDSLNSVLWDESGKNATVDSVLIALKNLMSSVSLGSESPRQLPPSILSVEPNSIAAFPLGLGHSTEYVAPRVALIGDAAHRVHPLAGQGVNLGFGDVKCLVETLETAVYDGFCVGHLDSLLDYEMKRQRHVLPMMFGIDALNRLYSSELMPVVLMRSLGVTVLDAFSPIKDRIMQKAAS